MAKSDKDTKEKPAVKKTVAKKTTVKAEKAVSATAKPKAKVAGEAGVNKSDATITAKPVAAIASKPSNAAKKKVVASEKEQNTARLVTGVVVSNKMDKTITVLVERKVKHPVYGKFIKRSTKFYAHDEANECQIGDQVRIAHTRPLSKLKRWRLVNIAERAK